MVRPRGLPRLPAPPRAPRAPIVLLALLVLAAACGTSGRSMQQPAPGATAPPRRPDPTTSSIVGAPSSTAANTLFTLSSPDFDPGGTVPAGASCDGAGASPALDWVNVPAGTVELALVVTDPDANGYVHWVVAGINPASAGLPAGSVPAGAVQLKTGNGTNAYTPLCPPPGATHVYDFTLYALDHPSGLTEASDTTAALSSLAVAATGTAVLTGSYTRNTAN